MKKWPLICAGLLLGFSLLFYFLQERPVRKIHLVWMFDPAGWWEGDWLRELLASNQYEIEEVVAPNKKVYLDHALYVTPLFHERKDLSTFFETLHQKGYKFGIVHLSDEHYNHSTKPYRYAKFVLRNCWTKKFTKSPKVLQFPLGYKTKFWDGLATKETKPVSQRKHLASFAGQITKSTRQEMVHNMELLGDFFLYETAFFGDGLPTGEYRDLLLESVFAPCPRGFSNLDTFRLCEALEAGCIPIVEKEPFDYYACLFEDGYPFLAVRKWDDVSTLLNAEFLADKEGLERKRQECTAWWQDQKEQFRYKIENLMWRIR